MSATPGKTKHYQTHVLEGGTVTLADGPGLVIPNLSMSKADMVLADPEITALAKRLGEFGIDA